MKQVITISTGSTGGSSPITIVNTNNLFSTTLSAGSSNKR
jgi:hypothetical protein